MHRIIAGYLKQFCEETFLENSMNDSKKFEHFANYCVIKSFYPEEVDTKAITSDEDDAGIDGICFIIDGEIATTRSEAEVIFKRPKRNIPVDIFFVQAKTSDNYDRGEILKFGDGVIDFISETSNLPQGDFIKQEKELFDYLLENTAKITNGRADCHLKYICNSGNQIAAEIEATKENITREISESAYFHSVNFSYILHSRLNYNVESF